MLERSMRADSPKGNKDDAQDNEDVGDRDEVLGGANEPIRAQARQTYKQPNPKEDQAVQSKEEEMTKKANNDA